MGEIRTSLTVSGNSSEYRSNIEISIVTLNSKLEDTKSSFRTILNLSTTAQDGSINNIKTCLELDNISMSFYLVDMTKLNKSILYFSKFFNINFEPEVLWNLLSQGTNEQINITHLSTVLSNYVDRDSFIDFKKEVNSLNNIVSNHVNNNVIHLTEEEKDYINSIMDNPPWANIIKEELEKLLDQISLISNWFGEDVDGSIYVKPKDDGTPRNFYTYGTMSFGGIDDGESGEGGGSSVSILGESQLGTLKEENLSQTFSAYAIDSIYKQVQELLEGGIGDYLTKDVADTYYAPLSYFDSNGVANKANLLKDKPHLGISNNSIYVVAGGQQSSNITVPYATKAGTADTADSVSKLSLTDSYTIFSQTFFKDGVPVSIAKGSELSGLGKLVPNATNTYDLGTSNNRWANLFANFVNLNGSQSNGLININNTLNNQWLRVFTATAPNLSSSYNFSMLFGKADSTRNAAVITYRHNGNSSTANELWFGLHSANRLMTILGSGRVLIGANLEDNGLDALQVNGSIYASSSIKIGEATLFWDAENQCLVVDKSFISNGTMSFGGLDLGTGGGALDGEVSVGSLTVEGATTLNGVVTIKNAVMSKSMVIGSKIQNIEGEFGACSIDLYGTLYINNPDTGKWALLKIDSESEETLAVLSSSLSVVSLVQTSDIRYKQIIEDVCLSSEVIANAPIFRFTWKNSDAKVVHIGTSAQYWLDYAPELTALYDDRYSLDYATLAVLMGKSNATEIELLKAEVKELRLKVENYERMLDII